MGDPIAPCNCGTERVGKKWFGLILAVICSTTLHPSIQELRCQNESQEGIFAQRAGHLLPNSTKTTKVHSLSRCCCCKLLNLANCNAMEAKKNFTKHQQQPQKLRSQLLLVGCSALKVNSATYVRLESMYVVEWAKKLHDLESKVNYNHIEVRIHFI